MVIPFFEWIKISVGPLTFYVWGIFVAAGIIISFLVLKFLFKLNNEKKGQLIMDLGISMVIFGVIFARLFYIVFYSSFNAYKNLFAMFYVWDGGMSSVGGIFGGLLVILWYKKKFKNELPGVLDYFAVAAPWGWAVGRLGCFVIHDHIGYVCPLCPIKQTLKNGQLGTDLGLYESIIWFIIGILVLLSIRFNFFERKGEKFVFVIVLFSVGRFILDFLRIGDPRYFGLTLAQFTCLIVLIISLFFTRKFLSTKKGVDLF